MQKTTMRAPSVLVAFIVLVAGLAGCSMPVEPMDSGSSRCTAGQVISCPCLGGGSGVQTCRSDGTYGMCMCAADANVTPDVTDATRPVDVGVDVGNDTMQPMDSGGPTDTGTPVDSGPADTGSTPDTGTPIDSGFPDVAPPVDVVTPDAGPASGLYAHCATSATCGTGLICSTAYPGGLCTRSCTSDSVCGPGGWCEASSGLCLPACTTGGLECDRFGGACVSLDSTDRVRVCLATCFQPASPDAPAGVPFCPATMPCDSYTGICTTTPATGGTNGAGCTVDADCRGGRCIAEVDASGPSGWVGGYCLSFGRQGTYAMGSPVPRGSCPPGSGTVPINGEAVGDDAPCFQTCNATTDCRAGYQCDHLQPSSGTGDYFTNGICLPVNCALSGMTCPSGYVCTVTPTDSGTPSGICTR